MFHHQNIQRNSQPQKNLLVYFVIHLTEDEWICARKIFHFTPFLTWPGGFTYSLLEYANEFSINLIFWMDGGKNNAALLKERRVIHINAASENNPSEERIQIRLYFHFKTLKFWGKEVDWVLICRAVENLCLTCLRNGTANFSLIHFIHALKLPFTTLKSCVWEYKCNFYCVFMVSGWVSS